VDVQQHYLLAVDVGLHTGLALYDDGSHLLWYRSHHLPTPAKLKKMVASLLRQPPRPTHIYLEGSGPLADIWSREASKLNLSVTQVVAETWRSRLLLARQQTSGLLAKQEADFLARRVIVERGGKKPTQLRHDTAEAILVGLYALLDLGWLECWPDNRTYDAKL
jgi:hypothetical protein